MKSLNQSECSISTHALTWSATDFTGFPRLFEVISTHALTWSATRAGWLRRRRGKFQLTRSRGARRKFSHRSEHRHKFQLTRSRGARRNSQNVIVLLVNISTHALTWSATPFVTQRMNAYSFQLTRSRGARLTDIVIEEATELFQLTRSRGARPHKKCRAKRL